MFSDVVARRVSQLGIDAQPVPGVRHRRSLGKEMIVETALSEGRVIVTDNVIDLEILRSKRETTRQPMPGIIDVTDVIPATRSS